MEPGVFTTFDATAEVEASSRPLGGAFQFDPGTVALMGTPLGGGNPDMFLAYCAQTAGCSAMQYSSSTKLVPAGSLSVTGFTGRLGKVTLAFAPFAFSAGLFQL